MPDPATKFVATQDTFCPLVDFLDWFFVARWRHACGSAFAWLAFARHARTLVHGLSLCMSLTWLLDGMVAMTRQAASKEPTAGLSGLDCNQ